MRFPFFSIRSSVLGLIAIMGLWAFVLAISTLYFSTQYILDNEKQAYGELVQIHANKLLEELNKNSVNLAIKTQQDKEFRQAFAERNKTILEALLNDQFKQYYFTAGIVDIKQLVVFDSQMLPIAQSKTSNNSSLFADHKTQLFLAKAIQRQGPEKIKPMTKLIVLNDRPMHLSLTAIGGLKVKGYVLVISNPVPALYTLDDQLGAPVSIYNGSNQQQYQSQTRQNLSQLSPYLYGYFNDDNQLLFNLKVHRDVTTFSQQIKSFILYAAIFALLVTLLIVLGAIAFFNKSLIQPLEKVSSHMDQIAHSKGAVKEITAVQGNPEIHTLVRSFNLMSTHINELNDELKDLAYYDPLTQIPNRRAFNRRLQELTHLARKDDAGFCILVVDLNRFKNVNDRYGHEMGDQLLKYVAESIHSSIRETDTIARLGGDEFGIILPGITNQEQVAKVAQKILHNTCQKMPINKVHIKPTLSIGSAFYHNSSQNIADVINQADQSMYQAKKGGGGYSC